MGMLGIEPEFSVGAANALNDQVISPPLAQAVLEFIKQLRLIMNSQQSFCLSILSVGVPCMTFYLMCYNLFMSLFIFIMQLWLMGTHLLNILASS